MGARSRFPLQAFGSFALAAVLSATFVAVVYPHLDTLPYDFDEAWMMLDARFIQRGLRPFVDFAHHEPPLHLYLLALCGKVFGTTVFGFRMLSLVSIAVSGFVLFCLLRPFVGSLAAFVAQAMFLFSPAQMRALGALPEGPTVLLTLLGVLFLFLGRGRWSAYASSVAFVVALLVRPTSLVVVVAAALSLVCVGAWRRLRDLTVAGLVAATAGLAWVIILSDGVFLEILRFQVERLGTRRVGMWSIDSGFAELRRLSGIETPRQLALASLQTFYGVPLAYWPMACLGLSFLGVPIWLARCGRSRPALRVFAVLWPASYLLLDFVAVDFTSPRYFVPFLAFSSFLLAGLVWLVERPLPPIAAAVATIVACVALASQLASALGAACDPWYYGRANEIARQYPTVVSFTPMLFAATGADPGCGFANPALTYGAFGETFLVTERTRGFRFSDERLVECLRAQPGTPVVVDWAFYFFTRPGSSLRAYLRGEGSAQRLFFSPEAKAQWSRSELRMNPFR